MPREIEVKHASQEATTAVENELDRLLEILKQTQTNLSNDATWHAFLLLLLVECMRRGMTPEELQAQLSLHAVSIAMGSPKIMEALMMDACGNGVPN